MSKRRRFASEQIIPKLREAEVLLGQGKTVQEVCRSLEIHEQTCYRWQKDDGGMIIIQAKKLKELEKENAKLKNLVQNFPWTMRSSRKCFHRSPIKRGEP